MFSNRLLCSPILLAFLTVNSACQHTRANQAAAKEDTAAVAEDQTKYVDQAMAVINTIDYIPFWNWLDGCQERAEVMGDELTLANLPYGIVRVEPLKGNTIWPIKNTPQRVTPVPVETPPAGVGKYSWRYHYAIYYNTGATKTIIDPSMSPTPIDLDAWLALIGTDRSKVTLNFGPTEKPLTAPLPENKREAESDYMVTATKMLQYVINSGETEADQKVITEVRKKLGLRFTAMAQELIRRGQMQPVGPDEDQDYKITPENIEKMEEVLID